MVMINRATKEITLKIVYYGPGLCGKTTNLEHIYATANPERRGKLLTVSTETDRTLFFDFLPMKLGSIRGMMVRVQLYTVPGQVFYDATRRIVLRGSDGVVFVADSQQIMMEANVESVENLKTNLKLNSLDPDTIPLVYQYNKQDLPDLSSPAELEDKLNWRRVPHFLSVATMGKGVHHTLRRSIELVIRNLQTKDAVLKNSPLSRRKVADKREGPEAEPAVATPAAAVKKTDTSPGELQETGMEIGETATGKPPETKTGDAKPLPVEAGIGEQPVGESSRMEDGSLGQAPVEAEPPKEEGARVNHSSSSQEFVTVVADSKNEENEEEVEVLDLDSVDEYVDLDDGEASSNQTFSGVALDIEEETAPEAAPEPTSDLVGSGITKALKDELSAVAGAVEALDLKLAGLTRETAELKRRLSALEEGVDGEPNPQ